MRSARNGNLRRLPFELLMGLCKICADLEWMRLAHEEFYLKEHERTIRPRSLEISGRIDCRVAAARYAVMDDVLRG